MFSPFFNFNLICFILFNFFFGIGRQAGGDIFDFFFLPMIWSGRAGKEWNGACEMQRYM